MGPNLVLTDEEKELLELENVVIPEGVALTKEEEKVLKKVRRKIKNKVWKIFYQYGHYFTLNPFNTEAVIITASVLKGLIIRKTFSPK